MLRCGPCVTTLYCKELPASCHPSVVSALAGIQAYVAAMPIPKKSAMPSILRSNPLSIHFTDAPQQSTSGDDDTWGVHVDGSDHCRFWSPCPGSLEDVADVFRSVGSDGWVLDANAITVCEEVACHDCHRLSS